MNHIAQLEEFLIKDPADSFARFALALEYLKLNDSDKALEYFEKIRSDDPGYVGVYYHLGKLYERTGNPMLAKNIYEEGLKICGAAHQRTRREIEAAIMELEN